MTEFRKDTEGYSAVLTKTEVIKTDALIIGAGPVGLFAVFELGLLDMKAHLIDILDKVGGQCAELYPEKPIYDIPGIPEISGQGLTDALMEQIKPFGPTFHLGEMVENGREDRRPAVPRHHRCAARCSRRRSSWSRPAAARSSRSARRSPASRPTRASRCTTRCARWRRSAASACWSPAAATRALDWTLNLAPLASHLTLLHRRAEFRAAPDSVNKMMKLVGDGKIDLVLGQVTALEGADGQVSKAIVKTQRRLELRDRLRRDPAVLRADHEARPGRQLGHQARRAT